MAFGHSRVAVSRFFEKLTLWACEENLICYLFLKLGAALLVSEIVQNVLFWELCTSD